MRSPPGVITGLGVVRGVACRDGGGSARRCSPACQCSGVWGALPILIASAEGRGGRRVAHRGSYRAVRRCREAGVELGRRRTDGVRDTGRCRGRGRRRGLGGVPGLRAELVRWISGARERQGGGSTEAQRPCAAERDAARRARVRWRLKSEMGCRRGRGMLIKDSRGSWGGVPRMDAAAGIAAVLRARTKRSAQRLGLIWFEGRGF